MLATQGWWPWILTFFIIAVLIVGLIAYFVRRRRTAA